MTENTIEDERQEILRVFDAFTDGIRVLMLIHRSKEGGKTNNTKLSKRITSNVEEYGDALLEMLRDKQKAALEGVFLRIYASVNKRNVEKAIHEFKRQQLDADYYDLRSRNMFYFDAKNRFVSALMKHSSKAESQFMLDVDREDIDVVLAELEKAGAIVIKDKFKSKNGWHVVTEPFNPSLVDPIEDVEVQKDGLLLLSY